MTATTVRVRRTDFVLRQLTVSVLIELFQSHGCIGQFIGVNDSIPINVQRGDEG